MPDGTQTVIQAKQEAPRNEVVPISRPRLPWHPELKERFGVDAASWRALIDAVWPSAKTVDALVLALSYCKARNLDPFKRPVHIVPIWSEEAGKMVESVWPGIGELRTTAFRTGLYGGRDKPEFGPDQTLDLGGVAVTFPQWCEITVYRLGRNGQRMPYPGPRVYWLETYATASNKTVSPNKMWRKRPRGQLEKCAEAAALRAAFPEELGNEYAADEMAGQMIEHGPPPPRPQPEDFIDQETTSETQSFEIIDFVGEAIVLSSAEQARDTLLEMIQTARSPQALEGLWESNAEGLHDIEQVLGSSELSDAFSAAKKEFEHDPRQSDASPEKDKPANQQEQGEGTAGTEPQKAVPPTLTKATQSPSGAHAPRDEAFWSQKEQKLPGKTAKEILYYASNVYLRQCRDEYDINAIEMFNSSRIELTARDQRELDELIARRRSELGAS